MPPCRSRVGAFGDLCQYLLLSVSFSVIVGINHENLKNRLGAYHAPIMTFLDFNMLKTLPEGQVRNGFAGRLLPFV